VMIYPLFFLYKFYSFWDFIKIFFKIFWAIGKVNSHSAEASGILDIVGKGPTIWLGTAQK
ncbi:MAG: hypothetical protein R6U98_06435, partial [Pirellulaceae bacterium]